MACLLVIHIDIQAATIQFVLFFGGIQSCNQITLGGHRQDFQIITLLLMWLNPGPAASSSALCFSFYLKLSVAQVISSKEDAKTTTGSEWWIDGSEWWIEDFCLWHSLSSVPFLKVSFDKKLLKTIQNNCFTLLLSYLYFFF